jgi:hypothetical protein
MICLLHSSKSSEKNLKKKPIPAFEKSTSCIYVRKCHVWDDCIAQRLVLSVAAPTRSTWGSGQQHADLLPNNKEKVARRLGTALDSFDAQAIVLVKHGTEKKTISRKKSKYK